MKVQLFNTSNKSELVNVSDIKLKHLLYGGYVQFTDLNNKKCTLEYNGTYTIFFNNSNKIIERSKLSDIKKFISSRINYKKY